MISQIKSAAVIIGSLLLPQLAAAATVYETQAEFLERAFGGSPPEPAMIWFTGERKSFVRQLLGHDYPALRLRYWCRSPRSAWVVEEIGKDLPITVGVIIENNYVRNLRVLTYRENRGGEVATPAFTDQFNGATLDSEGKLANHIDGISGATLSVRALTRLASLTLFLHTEVACQNGT